jgi:hypothetical protein
MPLKCGFEPGKVVVFEIPYIDQSFDLVVSQVQVAELPGNRAMEVEPAPGAVRPSRDSRPATRRTRIMVVGPCKYAEKLTEDCSGQHPGTMAEEDDDGHHCQDDEQTNAEFHGRTFRPS